MSEGPRRSARLVKTHKNAGHTYPSRLHVPEDFVRWSIPWGDYEPTWIDVHGGDKPPPWADPAEPSKIKNLDKRASFEGPLWIVPPSGRPLNPRGRTGVSGRGRLGKWGPNHAADPIVTRFDPKRPTVAQMAAIKRGDTGAWACPGGMVDAGEAVRSQTPCHTLPCAALRRSFARSLARARAERGRRCSASAAPRALNAGLRDGTARVYGGGGQPERPRDACAVQFTDRRAIREGPSGVPRLCALHPA